MDDEVKAGSLLEYIKNKKKVLKVIVVKDKGAYCYFPNAEIPNNSTGRTIFIKHEYLKYFNKIN